MTRPAKPDLQRQEIVGQLELICQQSLTALIKTEKELLEGPVGAWLEFDEHAEFGSGYTCASESPALQVCLLGGAQSRRQQHGQEQGGEDISYDARRRRPSSRPG